jgi:hypothetical protein
LTACCDPCFSAKDGPKRDSKPAFACPWLSFQFFDHAPAQWIREAYLDVLNRPAAVNEMAYWLNFLKG